MSAKLAGVEHNTLSLQYVPVHTPSSSMIHMLMKMINCKNCLLFYSKPRHVVIFLSKNEQSGNFVKRLC